MLHTHTLVVTLFLLTYAIKTILLLGNKTDLLAKFTKMFKVPEMIISSLFLITGIYLAMNLPFGSKYDYLFWIKITMVLISIPLAIIGFKKSNKILASLSLLLITGSYGIAEVYSKRKNITKDGASTELVDGKSLYDNTCKMCHGDDGKLGMAGASDLSATTMDTKAISDIILSGKGSMPAANVNQEQAAAIAEFVNTNIKAH